MTSQSATTPRTRDEVERLVIESHSRPSSSSFRITTNHRASRAHVGEAGSIPASLGVKKRTVELPRKGYYCSELLGCEDNSSTAVDTTIRPACEPCKIDLVYSITWSAQVRHKHGDEATNQEAEPAAGIPIFNLRTQQDGKHANATFNE